MGWFLFAIFGVIVVIFGLSIGAYDPSANDAINCKPYQVAETPDNVLLWGVSPGCSKVRGSNPVYFSSRGTQYNVTEHQGKTSVSRSVTVPNTDYMDTP